MICFQELMSWHYARLVIAPATSIDQPHLNTIPHITTPAGSASHHGYPTVTASSFRQYQILLAASAKHLGPDRVPGVVSKARRLRARHRVVQMGAVAGVDRQRPGRKRGPPCQGTDPPREIQATQRMYLSPHHSPAASFGDTGTVISRA